MTYLYHLSESKDFHINPSPASLESEGFVHLSSADQVLRTADRWFGHTDEIKLVILREDHLGSALKWEDTHQHGEDFPHLYSPIPSDAIETITRLIRGTDGRFSWPKSIDGNSLLLETLDDEPAVIEPSKRFPTKKLPELCLLCFFQEVLDELPTHQDCRMIEGLGSEIGARVVYILDIEGLEVAVCHPGVGGPVAAATLEELIALGCRNFFVCGGAGSLVPEQTMGHLVLPDRAFRDEGLSHHYLAPCEALSVDSATLDRARLCLESLGVEHTIGASWTTDALYRETPSRIARRRKSGCLTVEMELASLLAVATYRETKLGAILYCGDDVGSADWDFRDWTSALSVRERLFWLSLEIVKAQNSASRKH